MSLTLWSLYSMDLSPGSATLNRMYGRACSKIDLCTPQQRSMLVTALQQYLPGEVEPAGVDFMECTVRSLHRDLPSFKLKVPPSLAADQAAAALLLATLAGGRAARWPARLAFAGTARPVGESEPDTACTHCCWRRARLPPWLMLGHCRRSALS